MAISQRKLTLEQFLALPETKPALEFHDGVVTQKMSPKGPHGKLQPDDAVAGRALPGGARRCRAAR